MKPSDLFVLKLNSVVHHLPSVGPKDVGVKRVLPRLYKRRSKGKEAAIQVLKFLKEAFFLAAWPFPQSLVQQMQPRGFFSNTQCLFSKISG